MGGGGKILLLTLALTGLLASCTSKSKPLEPTPPPAPVIYTLTLDANGGSLATGTNATQQVLSGEKAQRPADPSRTGYDFAGWTPAQTGGNPFDFAGEAITEARTLYAQWALKTYAVRFDANGGSPAPPPQQVRHGSQATRPADPTRADYDFTGWTPAQTGGNPFDFANTPITEARTLYAKWDAAASAYTLTLDANGGMLTIGTNGAQRIAAGSQATRPADPTRSGYNFGGWTRTRDGADTFDFTTETVSANITLYAKWWNAASAYTLTFDADGGSPIPPAQQLSHGGQATRPVSPTRPNYNFGGWTKTRDGADIFEFSTETIIADLTLYAKWWNNATTYTLTFDANGGSPAPTAQQLSYGAQATRPATGPTRANYLFAGWTKTRDGADTFDFARETVTANLTLYAKWNAPTYAVTFDTNGGSTAPPTQQVIPGDKTTPPADPTRSGYAFVDWTRTRNGNDSFDFANTPITADLTLYAKWNAPTYAVTFDANGGSATPAQQVIPGDPATPPATDPTRTGYIFAGWTKTRDGNDTFDFNYETITAARTLYAKWNIATYTVTFDANGGRGSTTRQVDYGRRATPPADPTRSGYTFVDWTTTRNGNDSFDFANTPITAHLTLYARWMAGYVVSFDANGGSPAPPTQQVITGDKATRPGYSLLGWAVTQNGTEAFDFANTPITTPLTLYARWQDNNAATYMLTFDANGGALPVGTAATQQVQYGAFLPTPTRAREGRWDFALAYWSADKRTIFNWASTPATQAITLYAMWSVSLPDANFRDQLKRTSSNPNYPSVSSAFDGDRLVVSHADVTGLASMNVGGSIADLSGIEFFTALTSLYCGSNQLTSLDVSRNTALTRLLCDNNQLTGLDVSRNTALTRLLCDNNQLTGLDVSRNTALTTLSCSNNRLTALDLSRNTALTSLVCSQNLLTALDVSGNAALTYLSCSENQLTGLDVSRNTALTTLSCSSNQLTGLDVSRNTALTTLSCSSNQLTGLDVSRNTALLGLSCGGNRLTALDVSRNTALGSLSCFSNRLTALDVSRNIALRSLSCFGNQLTALDVSRNTALYDLDCSNNQLTALDVSRNIALRYLGLSNNLKDDSNVSNLKARRGRDLTIVVYTGSTITCSNYLPGQTTGSCLTP